MGLFLKQSTAVTVKVGPFVDSGDGTTAETGLTIQKADVRLSKNGGNMAAASADQGGSDAGAAHDELGVYDISLDATDTNTLGRLRVDIKESGALHAWKEFTVLPGYVYDSLFGANSAPAFGIVDYGTAQAATGTTLQLRSAAGFADSELVGATAYIVSGTGAGQSRVITAYTNSTDTATVDTWDTTPGGTIVYIIFAGSPASSGAPVPVNVTQWLGTAAATPTVAGVPEVDLTHIAGTAHASTQIRANVVQVSGDATAADNLEAAHDGTGYDVGGIDVSELNGIVDDLINGGRLDLLIDAIKAKTDSLTFTKSGEVDANVQSINGAEITGDGDGTPFDVA